ncbi:nucleotide sugar dehydrogenase [Candidatus Pelagibacter sp.]|nr:nucleotide sugar dehydrogenase [Candidatus Pelagibacter sp.]
MKKKINLAIIGLGYVGLPLACEFAKKKNIVCFDINKERINQLLEGNDLTKEVTKKELKNVRPNILFTSNKKDLENINCYILTVPTPIYKSKKPNLKPLKDASIMVGKFIKKGDVIIYESTVFPGCTEEVCVPLLEKSSKLKYNKDFFCGYSPERINPGIKKYGIKDIKKITSGSTNKVSKFVNNLYKEIIEAGTFKAKSIKVAEAAKVIENTQRDLNIALINELSIIFNRINIDIKDVLNAAKTKWNFTPYQPGLVGGHCIGVDPYYLTYKAKKIGYNPKVILAGRYINNNMSKYIVKKLFNEMVDKYIGIKSSKILLMGLTFKENCPDVRNSGVKTIYNELQKKCSCVDLFDPQANHIEIKKIYKRSLLKKINRNFYDVIIVSVAHNQFKKMGIDKIASFGKKSCIIYDLKHIFPSSKTSFRL